MNLSCHETRVNANGVTYLMPGQELCETPEGDVTEDRCLHHRPLIKRLAQRRSLKPYSHGRGR